MKFHKSPLLPAVLLMAAGIHAASAATVTWTGNGNDNLYTNAANWSGGFEGGAPRDSDFRDDLLFGSPATPTTIELSSSTSIDDVVFNTAGWEITGSGQFDNIGKISSAGAGTNIFSTGTLNLQGSQTWVIGIGNTLRITNQLYIRSSNITLSEPGTLQLDSAIGGFGGSSSFGINIGVGTVQAGSANIFTGGISSNASLRFTDASGVLRVPGSTANAQTLIDNNRILNNTGGGTFQITDLGGGFSQVTIVPEPSALLLGGLGALAFLRRRR